MNTKLFSGLITATCSFFLLAGCDGIKAITPVDFPEGNCVGTVSDGNGAPIQGASVFLVAEGYSPIPSGSGSGNVYSALSDASGHFGFQVASNGKYNLLASGNNRYVLRKSIGVSTSARVELSDATLLAPGSLTGKVRLQSTTDHRSAVVLFAGTNIYAQPTDSAGNFGVPALAQGTYKLRFLGMESGFAVVETTITITSETATTLPTIIVPKKYSPQVDSFSVAYDPLMMEVNLSWMSRDTAHIDSFAIYCNREKNLLPPVLTVGKAVSSAKIDIILSPEDTFTYQIAAIAKDGWEGAAAKGESFVKQRALAFNVAGPVQSIARQYGTGLFFRNGFSYTMSGNIRGDTLTISKYDSNLVIVKTYKNKNIMSSYSLISTGSVGFDGNGNLYMLVRDSTFQMMMIKLDPDLNLIRLTVLDPPIAGANIRSFAVSSGGSILFYVVKQSIGSADSTYIITYDPEFNLVSKSVIAANRTIMEAAAFGDTTIAIIYSKEYGDSGRRVFYFDAAFNVITIISNFNKLDRPNPPGYARSDFLQICSNNLFIGGYYADPQPAPYGTYAVLCLFNQKSEVIARCPFDDMMNDNNELFSDYRGNLFYNGGHNGIERCAIGDILLPVKP